MRIQKTGSGHKVWLTDSEIEEMRRNIGKDRDDIILLLGAYVGLRAFEIPQITPAHVKRTDSDHYRLRVPEGKDTKRGEGKPRDAYLPTMVESRLYSFQSINNLDPDDHYVDLSVDGVRAVVKRIANRTADSTGDEDFRKVSSHDLRRRFAQRLLVDNQMNPRVVMAIGGWDSYAAIRPYLNAPTDDVINDAFEDAGIS